MMVTPTELITGVHDALVKDEFLPFEKIKLGVRPDKGLTLHECIRKELQMKPDDSYYMYWEWRELQNCFNQFWLALDDAASKVIGRRTSAIAMAGVEEADVSQVLEMLRTVDVKGISEFPIPHRRPVLSESQVRFVGKIYGACLQTMGVLSTNSKMNYGEVFAQVASNSSSDEELLSRIDDMCCVLVNDVKSLVKPKSVVILRALGFAHQVTNQVRVNESLNSLTIAEFLYETNQADSWAELSDVEILHRLLEIAPEKAEGSLKAIEKFLSE
jgi:hypothetical protein